MLSQLLPWALAAVVIGAAGARLSGPWWPAGRTALALAVFIGIVGIERPPWPPVSASQHLPLVALLALTPTLRARAWGAALVAGGGAAVVGAMLLRRIVAREPLESGLLLAGLAVATTLGARGLPTGRRGLAWFVAIGLVGMGAVGATGSAYLSLDLGVVVLATAGLLAGPARDEGLGRVALAMMATVLVLAMRLSELPPWAGLGLLVLVGLPGLLGRPRRHPAEPDASA